MAFPVPEAGDRVHHVWLLEAVHAQPDVTVKDVDPADEFTDWDEGLTPSVQFDIVT